MGGGGDPSSNQLLERRKNCTITYIKLLQNQKEQIINKSNLLLHYSRDLATSLKLKKETTTTSLKNNPKQILLGPLVLSQSQCFYNDQNQNHQS